MKHSFKRQSTKNTRILKSHFRGTFGGLVFLLIAISTLVVSPIFSQTQLTQYFLDGLIYNPAFAGSKDALSTSVYGRQQWIGFNDDANNPVSPMSGVLNIHAPIYSINSGVGLNVIYDKLGFEKNIGFKLNYAYKFLVNNEKGRLGIGLGLSLLNKTINFDQLVLEQPGDPLLRTNQSASAMAPDVDFGVYYQNGTTFDLGLSATNLLGSTLNIGNVTYTQKRNLYLTSSYQITLSDNREPLYLIPSVLFKSNLINAQVDINARVEYNHFVWGGISYRLQDAVAIMAGVNLSGFRIGAAYDITTGSLSGASKGSIEIFIGYDIKIDQGVGSTLFNTRYL